MSDKPFIKSCQTCLQAKATNKDGSTSTAAKENREKENEEGKLKEVGLESRRNLLVHGFWKDGHVCVFDMEITTADAPSNRGQDPEKLLMRRDVDKKAKHLDACHERHLDFTPLRFTADGMAGEEDTAAMKRLDCLLATKWQRPNESGWHRMAWKR